MPPRRRSAPAVPAIGAGSWAASGYRFFVSLRRPRSVRIEAFAGVRRTQIGNNGIAGSKISSGGAATVSVGPAGYGTRWYPNQLGVATASGSNDASTCAFFLNVIGPGGFLGQSYAGGGDQIGLAVPEMQPGDLLYAVWSGGNNGDWCQLSVIGPMDVLIPA